MAQLFSKYDIFKVVEGNALKVREEVDRLNPNYLLNASEEDLIRAMASELRLNVPVLDFEGAHTSDFHEAKIPVHESDYRFGFQSGSVKGIKITIAIPYEGDTDFFFVRPSSFTFGGENPNDIRVGSGQLELIYVSPDNNPEPVKRSYESYRETLKKNFASLQESANKFNAGLETQIRESIQARKKALLDQAKMVDALGLPIKRRQGMPVTYAVPIQKHPPKIARPVASTSRFQPEPALAMEEYENILTIIRNMVRVMEQSPKAFEEMGEEDLRTHFLVQLNAQYEGRATGETFNFQGKTDIVIKEDGRNVFIAECKFWRGEKQFLETIDQLLSYLSWRDTKTAVIVFNRNAGFSDVLNKITEATPTHKHHKRFIKNLDESSFRYVFHQPEDANREVILSVLAFDVPTAQHRSK